MLKLVVILALAISCQGRGIDDIEQVNLPIEANHAGGAEETKDIQQENIYLTDANARTDSAETFYLLYRQVSSNTPDRVVASEESILGASFSNETKTVILIHGHGGNAYNDFNTDVKDAILGVEDVNLVVVDWSFYASLSYTAAAGAVSTVAARISNFTSELVNAEVTTLNDIHIIGFNIGAHIAGTVGRSTSGIARITGLDPARNLFESNSLSLKITDANYVEVIHTDGGLLGNGLGTTIGRVDFYANGGSNQPGCLTHACSHRRAYELFAASMTNDKLIGRKCSSQLQLSLNLCRGQELRLGTNIFPKIGSGIYRINTRKSHPF